MFRPTVVTRPIKLIVKKFKKDKKATVIELKVDDMAENAKKHDTLCIIENQRDLLS